MDEKLIDVANECFDAARPLGKNSNATNDATEFIFDLAEGLPHLMALLDDNPTTTVDAKSQTPNGSTLLDHKSRARYLHALHVRASLLEQIPRTKQPIPMILNPVSSKEPWRSAAESLSPSTQKGVSEKARSGSTLDAVAEIGSLTPDFLPGPPGFTLSMFFKSPAKVYGLLIGLSGHALSDTDRLHLENGLEQWQHRSSMPSVERIDVANALLAGLVDRLIRTLSCTPSSTRATRHLNQFAEERFSELLDIADMLACQSDVDTLRCALDYHENHRSWRARRLLRKRIEKAQACAATHALLARILDDGGRSSEALQAYRFAVGLEPDAYEHHHALGIAALRRLKFDQAMASLGRASELSPQNPIITKAFERAHQLQHWTHTANDQDSMPGVDLNEHELQNKQFHPETLMVAADLFCRYGTLRIGGAFDPGVIARCREQFLKDYSHYFNDEKKNDALQIGNRRFQVSITLGGAFNDPGLYANPFVLALMRHLLGKRMVIGSTVCATSLPGAKDQHWHKDHRALFTQHEDDTPPQLPPVAITTMIPLVDLDEQIGTTLVRKSSHRTGEQASKRLPSQAPIVSAGSCFLMDLSLSHKGQGNHTDRVRPIVNMVYHQSWFNDNKNFKVQRPLHIPPEEFEQIPVEYRSLVDWAIQPGPQVNQ